MAEKRREMLRQAIANGLTAGSVPSQTLLDAVHEYANEKRTMDYFVITADDLEPVGEPDEEAISAYFEENKQTFAAPEYRKLAVLAVDPQALAETIEITEDDARAEYEARIDRYQTPERREVRQIVFADEEEARAARAAIDAGKSFDDIAAERGLGPDETRLGLVRQDEIVDPVVGKAAFALEQGAVSDVIEGQFGFVLASVTSIEPGSERSFEEAREEILAALKLQRAENEVLDLFDEIEDARAGGQTLAEIATAKRLELLTIEAIDASGNGPDGAAIADLPGGSELVREAFASDVGLENDPIQQRGTTFIWYEVNEIEPARERTLDEVRDRVVAAWKQQQRDEALNATASEAVDRINAGTPITTVAGEHGKSVTSVRGVTRTQTSGPAGQAAVSRLFTLAKGAAAHTATQEGPNRIVFVMTGSSVPEPARDSEETERLADQLSLAMSNDLLTGYVTGLESEFDMSVNEKLLRELLGEPAN